MNDRNLSNVTRGRQRIVAVTAKQQIDARYSLRQLAVERESQMREHDERLVLRNGRGEGRDGLPRVEKAPAKDSLPEALLRVLHDEQAQDVYADWAAFGVKRGQAQCL